MPLDAPGAGNNVHVNVQQHVPLDPPAGQVPGGAVNVADDSPLKDADAFRVENPDDQRARAGDPPAGNGLHVGRDIRNGVAVPVDLNTVAENDAQAEAGDDQVLQQQRGGAEAALGNDAEPVAEASGSGSSKSTGVGGREKLKWALGGGAVAVGLYAFFREALPKIIEKGMGVDWPNVGEAIKNFATSTAGMATGTGILGAAGLLGVWGHARHTDRLTAIEVLKTEIDNLPDNCKQFDTKNNRWTVTDVGKLSPETQKNLDKYSLAKSYKDGNATVKIRNLDKAESRSKTLKFAGAVAGVACTTGAGVLGGFMLGGPIGAGIVGALSFSLSASKIFYKEQNNTLVLREKVDNPKIADLQQQIDEMKALKSGETPKERVLRDYDIVRNQQGIGARAAQNIGNAAQGLRQKVGNAAQVVANAAHWRKKASESNDGEENNNPPVVATPPAPENVDRQQDAPEGNLGGDVGAAVERNPAADAGQEVPFDEAQADEQREPAVQQLDPAAEGNDVERNPAADAGQEVPFDEAKADEQREPAVQQKDPEAEVNNVEEKEEIRVEDVKPGDEDPGIIEVEVGDNNEDANAPGDRKRKGLDP